MTVKKPGLGSRNRLDVLLSQSVTYPATDDKEHAKMRNIPIEKLQRGKYQPRKHIPEEALEELADSIKAQGIIQPIVVRPIKGDGQYEIIAGERRWRAAQKAGLDEVPTIVRDIPDEAAIAMALIENIQREDLNPMEEAMALARLLDEFTMTHQEVAEAVGKSRTTVTNMLRLLSLNEDVKQLLDQGKIETGHAKVLLGLHGQDQSQAARIVALKGLTVRETEVLVKKTSANGAASPKKSSKSTDPNITRLESDLGDKLGAYIQIQHKPSGKGKLMIHYNNLDELEGILGHIQ